MPKYVSHPHYEHQRKVTTLYNISQSQVPSDQLSHYKDLTVLKMFFIGSEVLTYNLAIIAVLENEAAKK